MRRHPDKCVHEDVLSGKCLHCGRDMGTWAQQQVIRAVAEAKLKKRPKVSA